MSEEEKQLQNLANRLYDKDKEQYDSKFIKIYNELKKHFKIYEALKAGSFRKGTKIDLFGDMDLVFTLYEPENKEDSEMRKLLEEKMKTSFPNDNVELKNKSVLIKFKSGISVDVVYLNRREFKKEKNQIKHIRSISKDVKDIIVLVKYVKYEKNLTQMKSYKIERNAIYSPAGTFKERLKDTISKSGGGDNTNSLYNFLLSNAEKQSGLNAK